MISYAATCSQPAVSTPYSRDRWARTAGSEASPLTTELETRCRPGAYDGAAWVRTTLLATGPLRSPSSTIVAVATGGSGARW